MGINGGTSGPDYYDLQNSHNPSVSWEVELTEPPKEDRNWDKRIEIKETDTKSDRDFAEKWNRLCGKQLVYYNKDGVLVDLHTGGDELGRFIQIQKSFIENGKSQLTNYRLYKNDKGYMLTIENNEGNISRMENLSEDELQGALENIQKRIDEGEEVKKQERDKQRQLFDSYANNESKKADSNLENALNNLA